MPEPNPKVTACLITYNHIKYISQAIESVLVQKINFPLEIVIADDFSTDGTREILNEYQRKYPEIIRLILQPKNVGPALNSIDLFKAARGEYIAYLDCDDFWTDENKLQKQFNFLDQHPDFAICFHNTRVIFEDSKRVSFLLNAPGQKSISTIDDILRGNFIGSASAMFRKVVIDDLPDWFLDAPYGDWCLHILSAQKGKIKYLDEEMASYRVHTNNNYSNSEKVEVHLRNIKFYKFLEGKIKSEYAQIIYQEISKRLSEISYHYRGINQFPLSLKYDTQNLKYSFSHKGVNKASAIRDTLKEVVLLTLPPGLTYLMRYLRRLIGKF